MVGVSGTVDETTAIELITRLNTRITSDDVRNKIAVSRKQDGQMTAQGISWECL